MGVMINGTYHSEDPTPDSSLNGEFKRAESSIRHWITPKGPFTPDHGRYHLFVAWNCPWAHRTLLARAILGLQDSISISIAKPARNDQGWIFDESGAYADDLLHITALHQAYARQKPAYTGRITMPLLWDKHSGQIVSNESADILRMFAQHFDPKQNLYPKALQGEIDEWNSLIHTTLNNGVYRAGFARSQEAYDKAVTEVFTTLEKIETRLETRTTLVGNQLTEADIRLFPTLARFDVAYHYAFKCNLAKISDFPNLWDYARAIYALKDVAQTVHFNIYKAGYFSKSELRNPLGIIPKGPLIDWSIPTKRNFSNSNP